MLLGYFYIVKTLLDIERILMSGETTSPESPFERIHELDLWDQSGTGNNYRFKIDETLFDFIHFNLDEAQRIKNEKAKERTPNRLLEDLSLRGLRFVGEIIKIDKNDVVGLIGEILSETYAKSQDYEMIYPKWKVSGSSKSRGIDLVARSFEHNEWVLILCESKHIHEEVKNIRNELSASRIRNRFNEGLNEFEFEKTLLSLARIIIKIGDNIRLGETMGGNVDRYNEYKTFLSKCLADNDYDIHVIVFIDLMHCDDKTFMKSIATIAKPIQVGESHYVVLTVIESENIEAATNEACEIFVG